MIRGLTFWCRTAAGIPRGLIWASCLVGPLFLMSARSADAQVTAAASPDVPELTLTIGRAHVLDTGPVRRIAVGNGKVIQATALDDRQVLVLPEISGRSSLHIWPRRGPLRRYLINVVGDAVARRYESVRDMLGVAPNLQARLAGESVVIDGQDLSAAQVAKVQAIAKRFPEVLDLATGADSARMIAMDVKFVEIKKSALKRLGVRWSGSANGPSFGVIGDIHRSESLSREGLAAAIGQRVGDLVSPFASTLTLAGSITSVLTFLVEEGQARVLAEPRLSCRSGGSAKFIAGGELPIPMAAGLGTVSVSFKEYGIKFDFSPTAMPGGLIAARIATEVSSVDFEVQVRDVPGLIKRRAETEIQIAEQQTMVIAGLLSEESSRHVDKVAGLGDIPILGHLFRSREFRSRQTDLAVFVTPRFVDDVPRQMWAPVPTPESLETVEQPAVRSSVASPASVTFPASDMAAVPRAPIETDRRGPAGSSRGDLTGPARAADQSVSRETQGAPILGRLQWLE